MKFIWLSILILPLWLQAQINPQQKSFMQPQSPYVDDTLTSKRDKLILPEEILTYEALNVTEVLSLNSETRELQKIKYYILNGETRLAHLYLDKLNYTQTKLKPIIYRYQGVLHFIDGNFEKSLEFLDKPEMRVIPNYGKVCLLKVLSQIALSKIYDLEKSWNRCQSENARNLNFTNLAWLDTLIELKLRPKPGATSVPFRKLKLAQLEIATLRIFLKMALYLNQEAIVVPQFTALELDQLTDTDVRELLGHLYFRSGELVNAYKLINGLTTPNAENIRGNLYLMRQKFELAYAQFKLALETKQNSQNALERLLPLSWILKDWERGAEYAERVIASPQTQVSKLTIIAAFLLQNEKYEEAKSLLNVITQRSRFGFHLDAAQINAYVSLIQNSPDSARKNAKASCDQYDLIYCWVVFQMDSWESFPVAMKRKDKVIEKTEWEALTTEDLNQPLKEVVYVNQLDIEELDDRLVKLIEKPKP